MGLDPGLGGGVGGAEAGDLVPEGAGMVEVPEVGELVEDDVVADLGRGLDETPVEGDASAGGAGAPAGALVADLDGGRLEAMKGGELLDARGELADGQGMEGALDAGAEVVLVAVLLGDEEVAELEVGSFLGSDEGRGMAAEPHEDAEAPFARGPGPKGAPDEPGFHPGMVASDEVVGLGEGAAPRDGAAEGSVALEGEAIEAGARMGLEPDGGLVFAELEDEGCGSVHQARAASGVGWGWGGGAPRRG